jgi:hypothetical protein
MKLVERGLAAAETEGTVWSGRLNEASFRGVRLGDLHVGLKFAPFLLGRSHLVLETLDRPGRAVVRKEGRRLALADATLTVPMNLGNGVIPLQGELRLQDITVVFRDGSCETAQGRVVSDLLTRNAQLLQWQGPELSAEIACRGRGVVVPLRGSSAGTEVNATLSFEADGAYRLETRVTTADPALASALPLAGFQRGAGGLIRIDAGRVS